MVKDDAGPLEIEIKACVEDLAAFEEELKAKGYRFQGQEAQIDIYFKHPNRDFAKTDEAVRLRTVDGRSILTYKGPKVDAFTKTREEIEVDVRGDTVRLLQKMGFDPVMRIEKVRRIYQMDDVEVCLDTVKGLGTYVELECRGGKDLVSSRDRILRMAEDLGLKDLERRSYLELLLLNVK